jgi:ribosomal protein S18 acetylase RimI-like enzyme
MRDPQTKLAVHPLVVERWPDFEALFGPRGACGGCWCMTPRLSSAAFARQKGAGNRDAMHALVVSGAEPGLLAYRRDEPVGWCAVGPRDAFVRFARSRVAKPLDERPAWAIACLYVAPAHRGAGVAGALVRAAVAHARTRGAELLEAWPNDPGARRLVDVFAWSGIATHFERAGFREVARRTPTRPYMRCELRSTPRGDRARS